MLDNRIKIYLRSKGGLSYGWGHVIRSLTLANYLYTSNKSVELHCAVEGDNIINEFMLKQKVPFHCMNAGVSIKDEERHLKGIEPDVIVVDMLKVPMGLLSIYRRYCQKLIIFNDLGLDYEIGDIIINPQLLSSYPVQRNGKKYLNGIDYFVLSERVQKAASQHRDISFKAESLLIVMGGCINLQIFEKIIQVIEGILCLNLKIFFILGYEYNFNLSHYRCLESGGVKFITGTDNIGEWMAMSDMAFASSGYVKYELAAIGVPSVLVSIIEHQEELAKCFVEKGQCAEYVGDIRYLDIEKLTVTIKRLVNDHEKRKEMSINGRLLIDCKALKRIENEMVLDIR